MCQAILMFVWYGLEPGSFGKALLLGDYVEAWGRAHSSLRSRASDGYYPISSMMLWTDFLPSMIARDEGAYEEWIMHHGLEQAPLLKIVKVKFLWEPDLYGEFPMPKHRLKEINDHTDSKKGNDP